MRTRYYLTVVATFATAACGASATAPSGTCNGPLAFAVGTPLSGQIGTDDCKDPGGDYGDIYQFTLVTQTNFEVAVNASGFSPTLALYAGTPNGGTPTMVFEVIEAGKVGANAYLPAGPYFIVVGSLDNKTGSYAVTSQPANSNGCGTYANWTYPGANLSGTITTSDCTGNATARQDIYELLMKKGQSVTVSASYDKSGEILWRTGSAASADLLNRPVAAGGNASLTFTAPADEAYRAHFLGTPATTGTISYTATIR